MHPQPLAYRDEEFLESEEARPLRILAEYLEPLRRFKAENIQDTVVFFGSARIHSREQAEQALERLERRFRTGAARRNQHLTRGRKAVEWSRYYEDARVLARMLTEWSTHARLPAPPLRRDVRWRSRHHGGGQSRRRRGRRQDDRAEHPACRSSRARTASSPTACTSSSTTSSCASSGLRIWRRRW